MENWGIVGYNWLVQQLQHAVATGVLSQSLLITGPESIGKRTLALAIAEALLCEAPDPLQRPCGLCSACRRAAAGNHPDLRLVEPETEGRGVKIEQIRDMERFLSLTPNAGAHKITVIANVELMNPNAGNALLKTLEEPPAYAHLILLATDADTLLPTIVSRSQHLPLRPLDGAIIAQALMERWGVEETQALRLARLSGGRMGWAVRALTDPAHLQEMEAALGQLFALLQMDLPARFELAQTLAQNSGGLSQLLEYWRLGWRDVLMLQQANPQELMFLEQRAALEALASRLNVAGTTRMLHLLTETQANLLRNANTRLLLETLFLDWPELYGI